MSMGHSSSSGSSGAAPRRSGSGGAASGGMGRGGSFFGRRKTCPFSGKEAPAIDYKDVKLLGRFVSERGKIIPSRITAVCAKKQRVLTQAIKRARFLALLPYSNDRAGV